MNIKAKFEIGQTVYGVNSSDYTVQSTMIESITINENGTFINVDMFGNPRCKEDVCFATVEEARAHREEVLDKVVERFVKAEARKIKLAEIRDAEVDLRNNSGK